MSHAGRFRANCLVCSRSQLSKKTQSLVNRGVYPEEGGEDVANSQLGTG